MTEQEIVDFIKQTEEDLGLAKKFLAMWRKRNGSSNAPAMVPAKGVQTPLIQEGNNGEAMRAGDYGATKQAIMAAIANCPPRYTLYDVEKALAENGSRLAKPAIQQGLSRLAKRKEIVLLTKGAGRKPAVYQK